MSEKPIELQPCPFCGGKARAYTNLYARDEYGDTINECVGCRKCGFDIERKTLKACARIWNKRTKPKSP